MNVTPEQVQILKANWAIPIANPMDTGEAVLIAFFTKFPQHKAHFKAFKNIPTEQLKGHSGFRRHSLNLIGTIDTSIKCLESTDPISELRPIWNAIGVTHVKRKIEKATYDDLAGVVIDALSTEDAQRVAWRALFDSVFPLIFEKY